MVTKLTVDDVLEKAIQREIESQRLYRELGRKVSDRAAKDAFRDMVKQERGHQNLLEQYRQGEFKEGALGKGQVVDYKIAEHLGPVDISSNMPLKDVFMLAANREKAASKFYLAFARVHPAGKVRKLLEDLASQELEHKKRVEFLYAEVAFPQTAGG